MEAIETLMSEHRAIERVIEAFAAFAGEASRKSADDKAELGRFVTFIRELADGVHHGKEEEVLFAALIEAGFPREAGPVGVMLSEHTEGRRLVSILRGLAEQQAPWSAADRQLLVEASSGYGGLLRNHIHKEDAILYPMAEQRLAPATHDRVDAVCAELDRNQARRIEELHALGEELVRTYAPHATTAAPRVAHAGGCF
ncbi:MAG: hemerythrin domain-containing protein [Anaeromyxobacteraceae bacterium]